MAASPEPSAVRPSPANDSVVELLVEEVGEEAVEEEAVVALEEAKAVASQPHWAMATASAARMKTPEHNENRYSAAAAAAASQPNPGDLAAVALSPPLKALLLRYFLLFDLQGAGTVDVSVSVGGYSPPSLTCAAM